MIFFGIVCGESETGNHFYSSARFCNDCIMIIRNSMPSKLFLCLCLHKLALSALFSSKQSSLVTPSSQHAFGTISDMEMSDYFKLFHKRSVLIVGDGDFSYSRDIAETKLWEKLVTSTLETKANLLHYYPQSQHIIESIEKCGAEVRYEVNATALDASQKFDLVVWNFPHVAGKQNIRYNRQLLKDFLYSASLCLSKTGNILISLCDAQSGMSAKSRNDWNKSWKLLDQVADSGLCIVKRAPFPWQELNHYSPQGHRGRGGMFFTGDAEYFLLTKPTDVVIIDAAYAPIYASELHLVCPRDYPESLWQLETCCRVAITAALPADTVFGVNLIDVYHCRYTDRDIVALQITYQSQKRALSREEADVFRVQLESNMPNAIGLS